MNSIENIIAQIAAEFAPLDAQILANKLAAAPKMIEALKQLRAREDAEKAAGGKRWDSGIRFNRQMEICGNKAQYEAARYGIASLIAFTEKKHAFTIEARNANMAKKLAASGIQSVEEFVQGWSRNGFNGTFIIVTDAGRKVVKIQTIIAGGYNIQCEHYRVLISVK